MNYSADMAGLDLFTAPFRSTQAPRAAAASRPQQPKPIAPQQADTTAPQPKSAVSPVQQPKAVPQPVKPNPPTEQPRQTNIPKNPVPDKKTPTLQKEQAKAKEPKREQKPKAEAPAKAQTSAQPKPEPPKKELAMDMTDHTIPAGKPIDAAEDARRRAHEEAEARRRAEWEEKQAAKKQAREAALKAVKGMSDAEAVSASAERVRTDVERLTRRNMKECVSEHLQSLCRKDPAFARQVILPHKSMIHCFQYINRKAKDYIQREMKDNDIKPENGVYGGDVPDGLCYQWAEDYFNDPDAEEDKEKEETFTPRPYASTTSKAKKTANAKKTAKKEPEKKQEPENGYEQMTLGVV